MLPFGLGNARFTAGPSGYFTNSTVTSPIGGSVWAGGISGAGGSGQWAGAAIPGGQVFNVATSSNSLVATVNVLP